MDKLPSFVTSTFSAATIITVVGLVVLCCWTRDVSTLKELAFLLLGGYGVKKGMETFKNGNGHAQEPPK